VAMAEAGHHPMNTPTNPKERGEDHMTEPKQLTDPMESAISRLEGEFDEGLQAMIDEGKLTEDLAEDLWDEFIEQRNKLMDCLLRVC